MNDKINTWNFWNIKQKIQVKTINKLYIEKMSNYKNSNLYNKNIG